MRWIRRVAGGIASHGRLVGPGLLLVVGLVGAGAAQVEEESSFSQFETDSTEAEKLDYVESNFGTASNTMTTQVIVPDGNVLTRELSDVLNRTRRLEHRYTELNRSFARGEIDESTYRQRAGAIERNLTATTDVAGSILGDGRVAESDLADAGHHLAAGTLWADEFERVYHVWLDERATPDPGEAGDDD